MEYGDEVVIATNNAHKLEEIGAILEDFDYTIYSLKDVDLGGIEIVEDGKTFEHNALIKARTIAKMTKMIAISDDSGLEVDAIGKKPGVYSARFAGENATDEENRQKLIKSLSNIHASQRTARFVSAIAVVFPDGKEFVVRGTCEGTIGFEEKGKNGFGYDSLFIVNGYNKTFAEMPATIKNSISHRANALKLMKSEFNKRVVR
jgi:non-canonical purine NTP pyrophosphatase (RdgB/HAM1 family)